MKFPFGMASRCELLQYFQGGKRVVRAADPIIHNDEGIPQLGYSLWETVAAQNKIAKISASFQVHLVLTLQAVKSCSP